MARISRAKLSDRFCSAVISCLLQIRNPRVATQDGHVSRQGIANERRNLVADQLNGSHDVPMLHADPLKPCDEPTAARCTQQVDDLFSTLLGRTDNEAVPEQILELGLRSGIADDLPEEPPIAEDRIAFRDCRTGIADGGTPVRRHYDIAKHREVDRSRLAELLEGRLESLGLLDDHRHFEMRGGNPGIPQLWLRDASNASYGTLDASAEPHRRAWLARHTEGERKLRCLEMPPLERHLLLREQALDQRHGFNKTAGSAAMIKAHDVKLILGPPRRDADNGASAAGRIEKRELLGDMQRFIER